MTSFHFYYFRFVRSKVPDNEPNTALNKQINDTIAADAGCMVCPFQLNASKKRQPSKNRTGHSPNSNFLAVAFRAPQRDAKIQPPLRHPYTAIRWLSAPITSWDIRHAHSNVPPNITTNPTKSALTITPDPV